MLIPEANWFAAQLALRANAELAPLLNLGSQSLTFRTQTQPWLDRRVFAPLRARGVAVVHSDLQADEGVDLVGDLTDPGFLDHLRSLRFRSVICSNLLEHVERPDRIAAAVAAAVEPGGLLFLSVPYRFPYHADPIDTMFRPSPAELASLFPTTTILEERILPCGNLTTYALGRLFLSPWKFLRDAAARTPHAASGAPAVVQPPSALTKLPWLFRRFRITCLVLRKEPA